MEDMQVDHGPDHIRKSKCKLSTFYFDGKTKQNNTNNLCE